VCVWCVCLCVCVCAVSAQRTQRTQTRSQCEKGRGFSQKRGRMEKQARADHALGSPGWTCRDAPHRATRDNMGCVCGVYASLCVSRHRRVFFASLPSASGTHLQGHTSRTGIGKAEERTEKEAGKKRKKQQSRVRPSEHQGHRAQDGPVLRPHGQGPAGRTGHRGGCVGSALLPSLCARAERSSSGPCK
jgi:hypothetical protein